MRRLLLAALTLTFLASPASAQDEESTLLATFDFDKLSIRFDPNGSTNSVEEKEDKKGSAIELFADEVQIKDLEAEDMRYCMDRDVRCSYDDMLRRYNIGNENGQVEAGEVAKFEEVATAFAFLFTRVQDISNALEQDITVDGQHGTDPRVVSIGLRGAEGAVGGNSTIMADVTMHLSYPNNGGASKHTILVTGLDVADDGFTYNTIEWILIGDKWDYRPDETKPATYKAKVSADGWKSTQDEFQTATKGGLTLVVEQVGGGKKKSPGLDLLGLIVVSGAALALLRRKA